MAAHRAAYADAVAACARVMPAWLHSISSRMSAAVHARTAASDRLAAIRREVCMLRAMRDDAEAEEALLARAVTSIRSADYP